MVASSQVDDAILWRHRLDVRGSAIGTERDDQLAQLTARSWHEVKLHQERRELADQRHRESLPAPVLTNLGMLLVTALPLALCWYLLHALKNAPTDEAAVTQLLVQDLVADRPILLPSLFNPQPKARPPRASARIGTICLLAFGCGLNNATDDKRIRSTTPH
ncbi:MAG: hypothetical protein ACYC6N_11860 [Pirellulaceae bacterium]